MHDPDVLGPEIAHYVCDRLHPMPRKHADHLSLHASGITDRSEQVEHGADREFPADRCPVLQRGVMERGPHEADAGLHDLALDGGGRKIDLHAQRGQNVGRA